MDDKEKIQNFGDMVDAVERLTKPRDEELDRLHRQMWWERIVLGAIIAILVFLAYLSPVDMEQNQDFGQNVQNQSYSEGATFGK